MRPAGALPSASGIAPVNCAALHVDRITNGQHHDPVDPAFPHLEAVLLVCGYGDDGWFGRMIDHCRTPFLIIPRMTMAVSPSESRRQVRGGRTSRAVARADYSQHP